MSVKYEQVTGFVTRHSKELASTAFAGVVLISVNTQVNDNIVEKIEKNAVGAIPVPQFLGGRWPWEKDPDKNAPASKVQSGEVAVDTYLGAFTTYSVANATINGKIFGKTYDTSKSTETGYVVSRIKIKGVTPALENEPVTLDTRSGNGATLFTKFVDGKRVGIDITDATFEMMDPEQADEVNGALQCSRQPEDNGFHGCVPKVTIRNGFFAEFPIIGEDENNDIATSGAILFDQYAQIERCHFDAIIIPEMNKAYAALADKGVNYRIDGENRYQEAMAILIRGQIRDAIKDSRNPQGVQIDIVGNYQPPQNVNVRLQELVDKVGFPFAPPQDFARDYCANGPEGTLPMGFTGSSLDGFLGQLDYYAIMGLPNVPDGYSPFARSFVDNGEFKAPPQKAFEELAA